MTGRRASLKDRETEQAGHSLAAAVLTPEMSPSEGLLTARPAPTEEQPALPAGRAHGEAERGLGRASQVSSPPAIPAAPVTPPPPEAEPEMPLAPETQQLPVRASVSFAPQTIAHLKRLKQLLPLTSRTDAINRAVVVYSFIQEQIAAGFTFYVQGKNGTFEKVHFM